MVGVSLPLQMQQVTAQSVDDSRFLEPLTVSPQEGAAGTTFTFTAKLDMSASDGFPFAELHLWEPGEYDAANVQAPSVDVNNIVLVSGDDVPDAATLNMTRNLPLYDGAPCGEYTAALYNFGGYGSLWSPPITFTITCDGIDPTTEPVTEGRIVFTSDRDSNNEIYVMDADGSNQKRLTTNAANDLEPAWSPDGTQIVFASDRDGDYEIYVMNADGSNQTHLTDNFVEELNPKWSPDGTQIAFTSDRDGNVEIYVMNADGTAQTRLTTNAADDYFPDWSPDGTQITFTSTRDKNDGDTNWNIYLMSADGSNQTQLTTDTALDMTSDWSPDGSQILFESLRDPDGEIYVMGADGTNLTRLTYNSDPDYFPDWSLDGSRIVFTSASHGNSDIYVMDADGNNLTRLTNNSASDYSPNWGPVSDATDPDPGIPTTISGVIVNDNDNTPIDGVLMDAGECGQTQTDANGQYSLTWTAEDGASPCTVTPSKRGYTFNPPSVLVPNGGTVSQNFIAISDADTDIVTLSGRITDKNGNGVSDVTIAGNECGTPATTDTDGWYEFTWDISIVAPQPCTIRPSKEGYFFDPPWITVDLPQGSDVYQNFLARDASQEKRPLIFIHGILGSKLYEDNGIVSGLRWPAIGAPKERLTLGPDRIHLLPPPNIIATDAIRWYAIDIELDTPLKNIVYETLLTLQRGFENPSKQQRKTVLNEETNTHYGA
jgi:Tol biopolymer transport system component